MLWWRAWQPIPVFLPGESPGTEDPGGLQSMGLQRVRHDWATKHGIEKAEGSNKHIIFSFEFLLWNIIICHYSLWENKCLILTFPSRSSETIQEE